MESILAAEAQAKESERAALDRSRQMKTDAVNRADDMKAAAERGLKEEIKTVLEKARIEGEAQAAERVKQAAKSQRASDAGKPSASRAAAYIEWEFYKRIS
ncbi:hypothetical protein FACS1894211_13710 [Clostridia bacterium]|nr:hypothetical protein FACS1894211_13710 [Clostridia bacterium]